MSDDGNGSDENYNGKEHENETEAEGEDEVSIDREPGSATGKTVRYTVEMPEHLKDAGLRNTEWGEMAQEVRDLFSRKGYGEDIQHEESLKRELSTVRNQVDDIDSEIRNLQAEKEGLQRKAARLEEQVAASDSRKQKYQGMLETIESILAKGHVFPGHPAVESAAALMQIEEEDVIKDLKDRNPAIPDYAFKPLDQAEHKWTGYDD